MVSAVRAKRAEIAELCAAHHVRRLAVFGSAAGGQLDAPASDVDILVEFRPMSPAEHAERYFGLMEDLERLLALPVDLVERDPIRNPYFRRAVEETQVVLYEPA